MTTLTPAPSQIMEDEAAVRQVYHAKSLHKSVAKTTDWRQWKGVKIENNRVIEVNVARLKAKMEFPLAASRLSALTALIMNNNRIHGCIPSELCRLKSLRRLWLQQNQLAGRIPREIGDLVSLEQLWLNQNQLEGTIPESIAQMENLSQLYVYENKLGGALPLAMSRFDKKNIRTKRNHGFVIGNDTDSVLDLHTLDLSDYELERRRPGRDLHAREFEAAAAQQEPSGRLPPVRGGRDEGARLPGRPLRQRGLHALADVSAVLGVTALDLSDCELRGEVPAAIVQLVNLKELDLSRNALTSLPASIGELRLKKLKMAGNDTLCEPPLRVATLGMGAIRRYFAASERSRPGSSAGSLPPAVSRPGSPRRRRFSAGDQAHQFEDRPLPFIPPLPGASTADAPAAAVRRRISRHVSGRISPRSRPPRHPVMKPILRLD